MSAVVTVRQRRETARCHVCCQKLYGVKQWRQRELRGPPLGAFTSVRIIFYQLQGACGECVAHRPGFAPFVHPRFKRLSSAFAEVAGRLMEESTCEAAARILNYDSRPLWELDQWRMQRMKEHLEIPPKLDVSLLSADEVHMRTIKPKKNWWDKEAWQKKFVTNLVCYNHAKIIANAAGRDARALKTCLLQLTEPQRLAVEYLPLTCMIPLSARQSNSARMPRSPSTDSIWQSS
ncbi:MAG: hypothetical protein AB7G93_10715 [Bdellovibrionales bacterium]